MDDLVDKQSQRSLGGDAGVQLAERTCCRVARIQVSFLSRFFEFSVQGFKIFVGNEDFAANDEIGWRTEDR